ncbi:MAG: GTPase Era [Anaerolineae bacterium]|nr:GTPase Era [Anaerolineae bacterium]
MTESNVKPSGIVEIPDENPEIQESESLIEAFLTEHGAVSLESEGEPQPWNEAPLPAGHKSGFVALIGRPNVGKSTLVNALVGHKVAIVSRKPQTTRTRVTGIVTEPDHQIIFIDTPGIHDRPPHKINEKMIDEAVAAIPDADVILFVVDVSSPPHDEDIHIARLLAAKAEKRPVFFVLNKMDQLPLEKAEARIESFWALLPGYADSMPTSALKGTNIERLHAHLLDHLPEGPRYYPHDQITDQTIYQIAAELIREAVLHFAHQEVPHASAVLVEDLQEQENGTTYISARIWVERESQKPIMIGKGGQQLKRIGSVARKELERFVGGTVYLDLWVKVKPKWRDHDARLRELGFK